MKSSELRIALYTRIVQNHLGTHHSPLSRSQRASGRLDVFWRRKNFISFGRSSRRLKTPGLNFREGLPYTSHSKSFSRTESLEELQSAIFEIICCSTPVTSRHVIGKIEALMAEVRVSGKFNTLDLDF